MSMTDHLNRVPDQRRDDFSVDDPQPTEATLLVWVDRCDPGDAFHGRVGMGAPTLVFSSCVTGNQGGRINLAALGYAHQVTAVAFTPGGDCSSVTLREALDTGPSSKVAEYRVSTAGFLDLYTVGWAARTAELVFNP